MTKPRLLLIVGVAAVAVADRCVRVTLYGFREPRPASYSVIHEFAGGLDGSGPVPGLTVDTAGDLYGVTFSGGKLQWGTIFKLSQAAPPRSPDVSVSEPWLAPAEGPLWKEQVLSLNINTVGGNPAVPMISDRSGVLYGITSSGASSPRDRTS